VLDENTVSSWPFFTRCTAGPTPDANADVRHCELYNPFQHILTQALNGDGSLEVRQFAWIKDCVHRELFAGWVSLPCKKRDRTLTLASWFSGVLGSWTRDKLIEGLRSLPPRNAAVSVLGSTQLQTLSSEVFKCIPPRPLLSSQTTADGCPPSYATWSRRPHQGPS
jgi:hypothetical protein